MEIRAGLTKRTVAAALVVACMVGCGPPVPKTASQPMERIGRPQQPERAERSEARQRRARPVGSASGKFDFYLLNLSWSPEFCATHPGSSECAAHPGFIVHGLWPQNADGSYPEHCDTEPGPTDPAEWTDVIPNVGLIIHEWQTHGTCTGLGADDYFATVRKAFHEVKIPSSIGAGSEETMMPPHAILDQFARANPSFPRASLALSCGNNRLTAVEVCMSKDLQPEACSGVRSCRANAVKITPQRGGL